MAEHPLHTWNNEKWVLERFAQAIDADDAEAQAKYGQRLFDGIENDGWRCLSFTDEGIYLPYERLNPANPREEDIDGLLEDREFPSEDEEALADGRPLQGELLRAWRENVVERAFEPELATYWVAFECALQRRRIYLVATTKYGEGDSPAFSYLAAGVSYAGALVAVRETGFTGERDYEARHGEAVKPE